MSESDWPPYIEYVWAAIGLVSFLLGADWLMQGYLTSLFPLSIGVLSILMGVAITVMRKEERKLL